MVNDPVTPVCRILLVRPPHIPPNRWDSIVQTLMQLSDPTLVLAGVVDPDPGQNILIIAGMDGIPIVSTIGEMPEGSFTHLVMKDDHPEILSSAGTPWPRISFTVVALLSEQISSKNYLLAVFNRYRSFAQSLTDLIPLERALPYEDLICNSLRPLLSAAAVAYCEARTRSRTVYIRTSDPEDCFQQDSAFPLTEAVRSILQTRDRYFDELDPEKTGILHLPLLGGKKVIIFKLVQGSAPVIPFLMIFPPAFPTDDPMPEIEFQNALELSAPVLETSHALFAHRIALKRKSEHDSLTKILNRDSLDAFLSFAFQNARSNRDALSVLMIDIDHFKQVNDTYGHGVGDSVLIEVTTAIGKTLRSGDGFGRYGGEEFIVILPGLGKPRALLIAERIRNSVKGLVHPMAGKITISIGIASYPDDVTRESELIPLADQMMYEAKHSGRDRVQAR